MRLSIRLQNHGKKHHPYWWIVVAPQHKNIFGRFTEHIGFWCPRHNVNIKRQIVFNIPRLMYWLGNGAVPTTKIQKFMHMFGIFPKPWEYVKSPEELAEQAKNKKPYQEMNAKQKSLVDRKKKREQRQQLHHFHYHRYQARAIIRQHKLKQQLLGIQQANQFQNEVIRDMLQQSDLQKYDKLAQLSGNDLESKPHQQKLKEIKDKIRNAKSQLAMLQRHYISGHVLKKSKLAATINALNDQLAAIENQPSYLRLPDDPTNESEYMTTDYLEKKAKYELITKRFQKNFDEIKEFPKLFEPVTVTELASKFKEIDLKNKDEEIGTPEDYLELAETIMNQKNRKFAPVTKLQLKSLQQGTQSLKYLQRSPNTPKSTQKVTSHKHIISQILSDQVMLPSLRPVHPRPDLKTYIPQQHYDPIDKTKLDIMRMDALDPHEELQKYKRKKQEGVSNAQRKAKDHSMRMSRLRINTEE